MFVSACLHVIHLCRMDSSNITFLTGPFQIEGRSDFVLLPCVIEIPVFNAVWTPFANVPFMGRSA